MSQHDTYKVIVDENGHEKWYDGDKLIKEKTSLGLEAYYLNNKYHSITGPAFIDIEGNKYYYIYGHLHREKGPAIEYADGTNEWFLFGKQVTETEFLNTKIPNLFKDIINCKTKTCAYQMAKETLESTKNNDVYKFKLLKYIQNKENKWVSMILSAMGDTSYTLSEDFIEIILNYIDEDNDDLVQSAAISLLYGGDLAIESLIRKIIPEFKYRKILKIMFLTNPNIYSVKL